MWVVNTCRRGLGEISSGSTLLGLHRGALLFGGLSLLRGLVNLRLGPRAAKLLLHTGSIPLALAIARLEDRGHRKSLPSKLDSTSDRSEEMENAPAADGKTGRRDCLRPVCRGNVERV